MIQYPRSVSIKRWLGLFYRNPGIGLVDAVDQSTEHTLIGHLMYCKYINLIGWSIVAEQSRRVGPVVQSRIQGDGHLIDWLNLSCLVISYI